jgi:uncharacterized membrane protein
MDLDLSRVRRPEWIVGAGGVVLLASMFVLSWYQLTQGAGPPGGKIFIKTSVSGWSGLTHLRWLVLLTVLAAFALVLLQAGRRAPALPVGAAVAVTIIAAVTLVWLVYRVLISAPGGRQAGAFVGLLSTCAIVYGGYESMRREGIAARDQPQDVPTVTLEDDPRS